MQNDAGARATEEKVRSDVSVAAMSDHLNQFNTLFRDTGSDDERKAAEYVLRHLRSYGVESSILEFDSLISWPLEGSLHILDERGEVGESVKVRTRAFGAKTPPEGVVAELVFVPYQAPSNGATIHAYRALSGDYSGVDVRGKIVITMDGGPDGARRAEEHGAIGHVHIWPSDEAVIHEMIGSSVWGTPTLESAGRLPKIPLLGLDLTTGQRVAERAARGGVRVRIESDVRTEWFKVPLVTGYLPGSDSADYMLVAGHIDSWYEGITDNATGDVAILEMARVLARHRDVLKRGVRFCWWPCHSTGRYAGSAWYADNRFIDLKEHCVGYLNIDSPGVRETTVFDCRYNMAEVEHVTRDAIKELEDQDPEMGRPLRAADQSFIGIGIPSMAAFRMLEPDHPDRKAVGGCGGAWWWHSPEDTLDKADVNILAKDVELYLTMVLRMCAAGVLPYAFVASADDFAEQFERLRGAVGSSLDLSSLIDAATAFRAAAEALDMAPVAGERDRPARDDGLKRISRLVNPVLHTISGPYEMDWAMQMPILPALQPAARLAGLDPSSDEFRFLRTQMVRQLNRVEDALRAATRVARDLVERTPAGADATA